MLECSAIYLITASNNQKLAMQINFIQGNLKQVHEIKLFY